MGAWGPGLYSADSAADLRTLIGTLAKLPYSGPEIVDIVVGQNGYADDPADEDYTTFWLVLADQLHRKGIDSPAPARAVEIIDAGTDLRMQESLGMSARDVTARRAKLQKLRSDLVAPLPDRPRRTLSKPQPLLMAPGEVYRYPVDKHGDARNALDSKGRLRFDPVGWRSALILDAGHAYDYLAWYVPVASDVIRSAEPTIDDAIADLSLDRRWIRAGTTTKAHLRRMEFELLGCVPVPDYPSPDIRSIERAAVHDIGIGNTISAWGRPMRHA